MIALRVGGAVRQDWTVLLVFFCPYNEGRRFAAPIESANSALGGMSHVIRCYTLNYGDYAAGALYSKSQVTWMRPASRLASCSNADGDRSMLPDAHPGHRSTTVASTNCPWSAGDAGFQLHAG